MEVSGAVWRPLVPSAPVAEHVALDVADQLIGRPSCVFSDCLSAVQSVNRSLKAALWRQPYAGLDRTLVAKPVGSRLVGEIQWMRSHRSEDAALSPEDQIKIAGNNAADAGAKEAVRSQL